MRLIKLDEGDTLVAMAKVDPEEETGEKSPEAAAPAPESTDPAPPADAPPDGSDGETTA